MRLLEASPAIDAGNNLADIDGDGSGTVIAAIARGVGRNLTASIPDAEFVGLESDGHLLLGRELASKAFVEAARDFLGRCGPAWGK